ncbi:MAG: hypothetical protein NUK63_09555 [Candidatus Bathyarchaeum tardum]|nr:MAG: hypothetical protein NUK63_09555 [Candidatus Bathyarchaeum tardum]
MSEKGISTTFAAAIIIAIVAIAGIGVVFFYPFEVPAAEPEPKEPETVSSLQFTTEAMPDITGTTTGSMTAYMKNIGTDKLKLRYEVAIADEVFMKLIMNRELEKAWIWSSFLNVWMDASEDFQEQWVNAKEMVDAILVGFSDGVLKEFTYADPITSEIQTFKIAVYQVNPILEDSMFEAVATEEFPLIGFSVGGHYDRETGIYYLDGTADNMGNKDAVNCRFEVTFINMDTNEDLKTETVTIGNVPAGGSKPFEITSQLLSGLEHVGFRTEYPMWD